MGTYQHEGRAARQAESRVRGAGGVAIRGHMVDLHAGTGERRGETLGPRILPGKAELHACHGGVYNEGTLG